MCGAKRTEPRSINPQASGELTLLGLRHALRSVSALRRVRARAASTSALLNPHVDPNGGVLAKAFLLSPAERGTCTWDSGLRGVGYPATPGYPGARTGRTEPRATGEVPGAAPELPRSSSALARHSPRRTASSEQQIKSAPSPAATHALWAVALPRIERSAGVFSADTGERYDAAASSVARREAGSSDGIANEVVAVRRRGG
jgi:hypothetical protein